MKIKTEKAIKNIEDEPKLKTKNKARKTKKKKNHISSYSCDKCSAEFTCKWNLTRHISSMHKQIEKLIKCEICDKRFHRSDNYLRHMKYIHPTSGSRESFECNYCGIKCLYKHALRRHISAIHETDENDSFVCAICGSTYKYKNYLFEHITKYCPIKRFEENQKCSICGDYFKKRIIFQHYENDHNVKIERENFVFATPQEFYSWKKDMETSTNSNFIVSYSKCLQRHKTITFRCHRSGAQIVKSENRSRRLKLQGSKKLNAVCPAEIKFRQHNINSTCQVSFLKTHIGHDLSPKELSHIFLPKNEQLQLAADILCGVPWNRIINNENDDGILLSDCSNIPMNRINLLTKKDLHSIEHSYNVNSPKNKCNSCLSENEAVNNGKNYNTENEDIESNLENISKIDDIEDLEAFIERYACCFIYYKREYEPPDEKFPFLESHDIVVIFMSPCQESLLHKHGNNVITMDSTVNKIQSYFIMHTMLILDYDGEGIPVAFCVTNRSDVAVINVFLISIKEKVGILEPNTLLTGMEETHFNSWKSIMGTPPFHFFCSWHVKKTWEQHLSSKIAVKEKRSKMKKTINGLLAEPNIDIFYSRFEEFLNNHDKDTAIFVDYFKGAHSCQAPLWAYCYRRNAGLSINLHVEAFYNTLKYLHSRRLKFSSLYSALTTMHDYVKEKLMDTIIKYLRGKITQKLRLLRKAHDNFVEFAAKNEIRFEMTKNGEEWLIPSLQSSEEENVKLTFRVRKLRETCPATEDSDYGKCNLVCSECHACAHLYCCTCIQSVVKNLMCTHIHAVASIFGFHSDSSEFEVNDLSQDINFDTSEYSTNSVAVKEEENCDINLSVLEPEKLSEGTNPNDLKVYKEGLLRKIENVKAIINDTQSKNVLIVIDELLASVNQQSVNIDSSLFLKNTHPQFLD